MSLTVTSTRFLPPKNVLSDFLYLVIVIFLHFIIFYNKNSTIKCKTLHGLQDLGALARDWSGSQQ